MALFGVRLHPHFSWLYVNLFLLLTLFNYPKMFEYFRSLYFIEEHQSGFEVEKNEILSQFEHFVAIPALPVWLAIFIILLNYFKSIAIFIYYFCRHHFRIGSKRSVDIIDKFFLSIASMPFITGRSSRTSGYGEEFCVGKLFSLRVTKRNIWYPMTVKTINPLNFIVFEVDSIFL